MYDIVEGLHKALRIESTWAFVLVVALFFSIVGGLFAWIIDTGYKNSAEYKAEHLPKKPTVTSNDSASQDVTVQGASIQGTQKLKSPSWEESKRVLAAVLNKYKHSHDGAYPPAAWANQELKDEGYDIIISYPDGDPEPASCGTPIVLGPGGNVKFSNVHIDEPACSTAVSVGKGDTSTINGLDIIQRPDKSGDVTIIDSPKRKDTPKVVPSPKAKPPKQPTVSQSNQMPLGKPETPQPPMTLFCEGGSCAQSSGQTGGITAGTVNLTERPLPEVKWTQEPLAGIPNGSGDYTHPGVVLHIAISTRFDDPTFVARCDRPCSGISGTPVNAGTFWPNSGNADNNPNVVWLHFSIPSVLPSGQLVDWDIRSKDNQAIKVLQAGPYRVP